MNNNLNNNYNLISHRLEKISNMLVNANHIEPILDSKYELTVIKNFTSKLDIREVLPKKYIDFSIAINNLGGKLLYIKSGSTGHTFKGVFTESNNTPYAVKIVAYPKMLLK